MLAYSFSTHAVKLSPTPHYDQRLPKIPLIEYVNCLSQSRNSTLPSSSVASYMSSILRIRYIGCGVLWLFLKAVVCALQLFLYVPLYQHACYPVTTLQIEFSSEIGL